MSYPSHPLRSPEQWQQLIEQQANSGLTQAAFCASQGLAKTTFQHWKRRLKAGSGAASVPRASLETMFTPLDAVSTSSSQADRGWTIELELGEGVCLTIFRRRPV